MPGPKENQPLAEKRELKIGDKAVATTPLLIPSFSSKGFPNISDLFESASEIITNSCLISAYDVHYKLIDRDLTFVEVAFLDSGGYESSKDFEFSDLGRALERRKPWSSSRYAKILDSWSSDTPTVAVSFDHPKHRVPVDKQIREAEVLFRKRNFGRELLLKPETARGQFVDMKSIIKRVHLLAQFDAIGLTEKELGRSPMERMRGIAELRQALTGIGARTPIHIFGSLDPITSPLYFLAGADIFDGLTWLRMGYYKGLAIYMRNLAMSDYPSNTADSKANAQILASNYHYLRKLENEMKRYLNDGSFSAFSHNQEIFQQYYDDLRANIT